MTRRTMTRTMTRTRCDEIAWLAHRAGFTFCETSARVHTFVCWARVLRGTTLAEHEPCRTTRNAGAARMPRFVFDSVGTDSVSASAPAEPRRPRSLRPEGALLPQESVLLCWVRPVTTPPPRAAEAGAGAE